MIKVKFKGAKEQDEPTNPNAIYERMSTIPVNDCGINSWRGF